MSSSHARDRMRDESHKSMYNNNNLNLNYSAAEGHGRGNGSGEHSRDHSQESGHQADPGQHQQSEFNHHITHTAEPVAPISTEPTEGSRLFEFFDTPVLVDPIFGHIRGMSIDWVSGSVIHFYEKGNKTEVYTPLAWSVRRGWSATNSESPVASTLKRAAPIDHQTDAYLQRRSAPRDYQTNANPQPPSKRRRQPKVRRPELMQPRPVRHLDLRYQVAVKPEVDFSRSLNTADAEENASTKVKREYQG